MQADQLSDWLTAGGDARIVVDPRTGVNKYHASPYPRDTVTYASSTANDISVDAFAHLLKFAEEQGVGNLSDHNHYVGHLENLRARIRFAYAMAPHHDIVFAPSGTDLEYVAILACNARAGKGVHNILLGADEVGSGCIHSANGAYFASETALGKKSIAGQPVEGLGIVTLREMPVRDARGIAYDSAAITRSIRSEIGTALARDKHPLVHIVHGSKTGLILPNLNDIDALIAQYGEMVSFVVDACQARITSDAIAEYLSRGAIILLTGSKFMGGPPFAGFAIIPPSARTGSGRIGNGLARIFRGAEFPANWPGQHILQAEGNAGLCLRLEAAVFELERFQALDIRDVSDIIQKFHDAADGLVTGMGGSKIRSYAPGAQGEADSHPIEMRTLVTIDLGGDLRDDIDFARATEIQIDMMNDDVRLGQPVRCTMMGKDCERKIHRGTLRVGISMPQIVKLANMPKAQVSASLEQHMTRMLSAYRRALSR